MVKMKVKYDHVEKMIRFIADNVLYYALDIVILFETNTIGVEFERMA